MPKKIECKFIFENTIGKNIGYFYIFPTSGIFTFNCKRNDEC